MGGCFHVLISINESDIDEIVSAYCDDALEKILLGPGQFKYTEQGAIVKAKLRSDCKDFKRLSLPYECLMLQVITLVEDVVSKNISFEIGKKLANDVQTTFSKFKSKDDGYEKSKQHGVALRKQCTRCINKYSTYIAKVNSFELRSSVEDMILSHYLNIGVIPVVEYFRDIAISYENLIKTYKICVEFFKADVSSYEKRTEEDKTEISSDKEHGAKQATSNCSSICDTSQENKNTFFSVVPFIFGVGTFLVAAFLIKDICQA